MSYTLINEITLPVLPLRGIVVFPKMMLHFDVGRKKSIRAIHQAMNNNQLIFLSTQKDAMKSDPNVKDVFEIGVVAKVVQVLKESNDTTRVVIEGQYRAKVIEPVENKTCLCATVGEIAEPVHRKTVRELALIRTLKTQFEKYMELSPKLPPDIMYKVGLSSDSGELCDYVAGNVMLDISLKQMLLETINISDRIEALIDALQNEIYLLKIEQDILDKTKEKIDKSQKDYYLREQLHTIEEELGEDDSPSFEAHSLAEKIRSMNLSADVEETLLKECNKLEKMPYGSNEAAVIRTYIETCIELPWNISTEEIIDLPKVRKQLDKDHYGLDKVKERIIEQLAVRKLSDKAKGQIICFVGPPGVGKTSVAMSIAKAIGRKSARISLGGVKDEAEIRGHRRTYIGSMPGRIMSAIKQCKSNNPLLILDEIDKLSNDYKGDPTSALLEVLDSEQNFAFVDHYIDLPFDLSNVMFITTANDYDAIPTPLLDRMEVIELSSYTAVEKLNIAKKHLIPKQLEINGLTKKNFKLTDKAIYALIEGYTKEAGVRTLERVLASLMRKAAVSIIENPDSVVRITDKDLEKYLGPIKYLNDEKSKKNEIGVVNGLAYTSVGGTLLPIECAVMPGSGKLELTGSLGDVMQESAKTAVSYIRTVSEKYAIDPDFYKDYDIHIHAPEGATPKDGPSAGVTMALALYSALTSNPVRYDFAMTGEITLLGKVLPIGGLREKSMAAYRAKIKNVIIPKDNERDIVELDTAVKEYINFIPVSSVDEIISLATVKTRKITNKNVDVVIQPPKSIGKRVEVTQ
ncbi:MAG: endopeptidase La [Oscillospiraceae bacterium]|nr:endopeptidase La [Candidatus Ruminococcus equi]